MNPKFTKRQIEDWRKYEAVRISGRHNMWFPEARIATGLPINRYMFCLSNFSELKEAARKENREAAARVEDSLKARSERNARRYEFLRSVLGRSSKANITITVTVNNKASKWSQEVTGVEMDEAVDEAIKRVMEGLRREKYRKMVKSKKKKKS